MAYAFRTLWYDRQRFLPGVLAVAFSALLISLQFGLLLGLFSITSLPIDRARADIWLGAPGVASVDLGEPIRASHVTRLAKYRDDIVRAEEQVQGFAYWAKPTGGRELCLVIGSYLDDGALGTIDALTPTHRRDLNEADTIVVDRSDLKKLGAQGVGDVVEIAGRAVRIVGTTERVKSLAAPYVLCNISTARTLLRQSPDQATYVLAKCKDPTQAPVVVRRLSAEYGKQLRTSDGRDEEDISIFTSQQFSRRSKMHWVRHTKAGIALGYAALLGLLVGAVVTSQTLYAATAASVREFALLRAMGIPRRRIGTLVITQSFWVGLFGIAVGIPTAIAASRLAETSQVVTIDLPPELLIGTAVITMTTAMVSGLIALRSLRLIEPGILLR